MRQIHMTEAAIEALEAALEYTAQRYGSQQAMRYRDELMAGIADIAENPETIKTAFREELAAGTSYSLHLVGNRYIAYQTYGDNDVIIAGIFRSGMDLPRHLRELEALTEVEIETIRQTIGSRINSDE